MTQVLAVKGMCELIFPTNITEAALQDSFFPKCLTTLTFAFSFIFPFFHFFFFFWFLVDYDCSGRPCC